ncbi:MAG: hypothetical protein JNK57_18900, partial [Planctomycetaceae bacterium]|nr:hypothetical protein [Planctomycetaceae bacterium]
MTGLERVLAAGRLPAAQILGRQLDIFQSMLRSSRTMQHPNFQVLHVQDLKSMFHLYEDIFFNGQIDLALANMGSSLTFRVSRRMTSAG